MAQGRSSGGEEPPGRIDGPAAPAPDEVVDAVGLFCPVPIVRTAARVRRMSPGQVLELRADDPVTRIDLPNWCRGHGHRFLGWRAAGPGEWRLYVEVAPGRSPGAP